MVIKCPKHSAGQAVFQERKGKVAEKVDDLLFDLVCLYKDWLLT